MRQGKNKKGIKNTAMSIHKATTQIKLLNIRHTFETSSPLWAGSHSSLPSTPSRKSPSREFSARHPCAFLDRFMFASLNAIQLYFAYCGYLSGGILYFSSRDSLFNLTLSSRSHPCWRIGCCSFRLTIVD